MVNAAFANTCKSVCFIVLGAYLGVEWLNHMAILCLNFLNILFIYIIRFQAILILICEECPISMSVSSLHSGHSIYI